MATKTDISKADEIMELLASQDPHVAMGGMGLMLESGMRPEGHEVHLRRLAGSQAAAPFYMTVGEIAQAILAADDKQDYVGDNTRVLELIERIKNGTL